MVRAPAADRDAGGGRGRRQRGRVRRRLRPRAVRGAVRPLRATRTASPRASAGRSSTPSFPPSRPMVTMASADPRAVASYARRGMRPRWPAYYLAVEADELRDATWPDLEVAPCSPARVRLGAPGRRRALRGARGHPFGHRPAGEPTGHGPRGGGQPAASRPPRHHRGPRVVRRRSATMAAPSCCPWSRHLLDAGARRVALQVPGPHGALAPLLERGFTITDADMACATHQDLLADPSRHTMHGEARVALA